MLPSDCIVSLDVGTSSVRTLLFDAAGRAQAGFGQQLAYEIEVQADGGVEIQPPLLFDLCVKVLGTIHEQLSAAASKPVAVAIDTFWHSFLGLDADGNVRAPIIHLFDTRSTHQADALGQRLDAGAIHQRTGCRLHASYWPAKLLWLAENRPEAVARTRHWVSFGDYLMRRLFGEATESTSMVSASGFWNQAANRYDEEVLSALPITRDQLFPQDALDRPLQQLSAAYAQAWPSLNGIPWFPALGDGACNNAGSGCTSVERFSIMVGTSGAMRAIIESDFVEVPPGLWCYRVDRRRYVLGGALSNGGEVYAWLHKMLRLPSPQEIEQELAVRAPGQHRLVFLPFLAGERSPYWRADLRAVVAGMGLSTTPMDAVQAGLEAVALRFREVFSLMCDSLGRPREVIASGGALLASPAWTRMMADAIETGVTPCLEKEATARGAAMVAAERLGLLKDIGAVPVQFGAPLPARPEYADIYRNLLSQQQELFRKVFGEI